MQYCDVLCALLALYGLCRFFTKCCGMNAALTPLVSVGLTMLWTAFAGVAGILYPAEIVYYVLCFALGALSFVPFKKKCVQVQQAEYRPMAVPGLVFFFAAALVCFFYFAVRRPIFSEWDEVSFWGTAAKMMKQNNAIYTTTPIAWDWIPSQMPGLISFSYFLQFFGGAFAPWKVLLAYNIVFFAMFAAMLAAFSWQQYTITVPVCILGVLTPYFITTYTRIIEVSHVYMSSYGDIPGGMMFGAVMCWYYSWRTQRVPEGHALPRGFWGLLIVLGASSLFKDNTFVVELVGAGIIGADLLFFGPKQEGLRAPKKWGMRIGGAFAAFAATAAPYLAWTRYIGVLASQREAAGEMGNTSLPLTEVVRRGFVMLFSPEKRSERFNQVTGDMLDAFLHVKIFGLGSGLVLVVLILGIFLAAALFAAEKRRRQRTWLAMVLSTGGFIGYYWVLILSYSFIFREMDALGLSSYNRYVQSYYLGWFMLAVMMLALSAQNSRPFGLSKGGLLALSGGVLLCVSYLVQPQMSVLGYSESHFYEWRTVEAAAQEVKETIPNDGKIFYVDQTDNGLGFFKYCYELLPYQMDLSFGGGEIGIPENNTGANIYYHESYLPKGAKPGEEVPLDAAGLERYLKEHECRYILTEEVDEMFCSLYGSMFTDGLQGARDHSALIYKKVQDSPLLYEPVPRPERGTAG